MTGVYGIVGYGLAASVGAAVFLLLVSAVRFRRSGRRLLLAVALTAVWAAAIASVEAGIALPLRTIILLEALRNIAWVAVLVGLAATTLPRWLRAMPLILGVTWATVAATLWSMPEAVIVRGGLFASLMSLLLLEQVWRNHHDPQRHDLVLLAIGLGSLFIFDLYLYSEAELLRGVDGVTWQARGFAVALLLPVVLVGARRFPEMAPEVYVSRQMTYYTSGLLAIGLYLLLMAGAGYAIREAGAQWGEIARLTFFAAALVLLASLLASSSIRRQVRVFLSKHFYRHKYDYRTEWLRFVATLSAAEVEDVRAASVQAVAQILDAPGGVLYLADRAGRRLEAVAAWPMPLSAVGTLAPLQAQDAVVAFMRSRRWIVDLRERERVPDLYDGVAVPDWITADRRWRLLSPIFRQDRLLGFFAFFEPPPPFVLTYEDRDLLNTAGQHVAALLAQQEADEQVGELRQFEAYNRLTAFVMHDLKNSTAQLSLLVDNAVRHKHNPAFVDDAIATIANTSGRITRLIEQLRRDTEEPRGRPISLVDAVAAAVERCGGRAPSAAFTRGRACNCNVSADRDQLVAAIEHVIRNAQDAAAGSGSVAVEVEDTGPYARVAVVDTGPGMSAEFVRNRLFRPFDTTKGARGMGVGAYQARELARSLGGDVEVETAPGHGTRFVFVLPVVA